MDSATDTKPLEVMIVDEGAEDYRIPRASVYKLAHQCRIPCRKVGRYWRFRREAVEKWLDQREAPSPWSQNHP